jgi:hypothetical protein
MTIPKNATAQNPFIQLIQSGRIKTLDELKHSYRRIVMRTHPDALGSVDEGRRFVQFSIFYEEAKGQLLHASDRGSESHYNAPVNRRLRFFQELQKLESIDTPYSSHRKENEELLNALRRTANGKFNEWKLGNDSLQDLADGRYARMKVDKPMGPYLIHALAQTLRPVIHNVISFHLTGRDIYRKQARQNSHAIIVQLEKEGFLEFRDYVAELIADQEKGAAVFDQ